MARCAGRKRGPASVHGRQRFSPLRQLGKSDGRCGGCEGRRLTQAQGRQEYLTFTGTAFQRLARLAVAVEAAFGVRDDLDAAGWMVTLTTHVVRALPVRTVSVSRA